jgi:hypothetical protein
LIPISKITREKWAGDKSQVVEYWPSICEALSSNPSTMGGRGGGIGKERGRMF